MSGTVTMSLEQYEKLMSDVRKCKEIFGLKRSYSGKYTLTITECASHEIFEKLLSEREDLKDYKLIHDNYDGEFSRPINEYNMYAEIEKAEEDERGNDL